MDANPIVPRGTLIRVSVRLPDHVGGQGGAFLYLAASSRPLDVVSAEISRELLARLTRPATKP